MYSNYKNQNIDIYYIYIYTKKNPKYLTQQIGVSMARTWFTSMPDKYYLKNTAKGGRNAIIFTFLGKLYQ